MDIFFVMDFLVITLVGVLLVFVSPFGNFGMGVHIWLTLTCMGVSTYLWGRGSQSNFAHLIPLLGLTSLLLLNNNVIPKVSEAAYRIIKTLLFSFLIMLSPVRGATLVIICVVLFGKTLVKGDYWS